MKHRAFTLVELLITTSILVVVVGLTVAIFTGIANFQVTNRGSQAFSGELRLFEEQIRNDTLNALTDPDFRVEVRPLSLNPAHDSNLLAIRRNVTLPNNTVKKEWRFYCRNTDTGTLMRIRIPHTSPNQPLNSIPVGECTATAITSLVQAPKERPITDILATASGGELSVLRYETWPIQGVAGSYALKLPLIRAEIRGNALNGAPLVHRFVISE